MVYNVISNEAIIVLVEKKDDGFIIRNLTSKCEASVLSSFLIDEQGKYTRYILEKLVSSVLADLHVPISLLITEEANNLICRIVESNCMLF